MLCTRLEFDVCPAPDWLHREMGISEDLPVADQPGPACVCGFAVSIVSSYMCQRRDRESRCLDLQLV